MASAATFGANTEPAVRFAVQLTKVPAQWRLQSVSFGNVRGYLLAGQYALWRKNRDGYASGLPAFSTSIGRGSCYFYPDGQSQHEVIKGYRVTVTRIRSGPGSPFYQVCVPDADGLSICVTVNGPRPVLTPVAIFRNMRLLGTDPVHWTTKLIG